VRLFCAALVVVPVLMFTGALLLARTDWFMQKAVPPYFAMVDAEFGIRNRLCDVLVFGDSSALTGVLPWAIEKDTGLTTCSIAQTKGSVGVSGLWFLRRYLQRNPAPRVLVLAFAPEDWRPLHVWGEVAYVEGVVQLVRHAPFADTAKALVTHPNEAFGFVTFVYQSAFQRITRHGGSLGPGLGTVRDGHLTLAAPQEQQCMAAPVQTEAAAQAGLATVTPIPSYVESLRQEFSTPDTAVLLVSPNIPDCDERRAFYAKLLDPVLDAPLATQPITDYNDVDRHFTNHGAEVYSRQASALILKRIAAKTP
jgi:hypothetical protein